MKMASRYQRFFILTGLALATSAILVVAETGAGFVDKTEKRISVSALNGEQISRSTRQSLEQSEQSRNRQVVEEPEPSPAAEEQSPPDTRENESNGEGSGSILQIS